MTPKQYLENYKTLVDEFELKKKKLNKECALSNNPHAIGDIVTDHMGSIKIEKILIATHNQYPTCVYHGVELKKDLTPKANGAKRTAWQPNLIKK